MRVAIGADHNGVEFKEALKSHLAKRGHECIDVGPNGTDSVDYPDYAFKASEMVAAGSADRGILICGSGTLAYHLIDNVRLALIGLARCTHGIVQT